MQYVAFCDQLLSLGILFIRFIHGMACVCTLLPFLAEEYSTLWIYHIFYTLSIDRHLCCFSKFLAITNNAAMNLCTNFCMFSFLWGIYQWVVYNYCWDIWFSTFNLLRNYRTVFLSGFPILPSYQQCMRIAISPWVAHFNVYDHSD